MAAKLECKTCKVQKGEKELFEFVTKDKKKNEGEKNKNISKGNDGDKKKSDAALRTFGCNTPNCDDIMNGTIQVKLIGSLGEFKVL